MARRNKTNKITKNNELDTIYFLKLVMYVLLGSLWIKVTDGNSVQIPIPIGFMIGIVIAAHDHIQFDRKIGYAVLLVSMLIGFWLPFGIYIGI